MKEKITKIISSILLIVLSALICTLFYNLFLEELFGTAVSYMQWISILVISNLLIKPAPQVLKNDNERTKISRDIFKNGI